MGQCQSTHINSQKYQSKDCVSLEQPLQPKNQFQPYLESLNQNQILPSINEENMYAEPSQSTLKNDMIAQQLQDDKLQREKVFGEFSKEVMIVSYDSQNELNIKEQKNLGQPFDNCQLHSYTYKQILNDIHLQYIGILTITQKIGTAFAILKQYVLTCRHNLQIFQQQSMMKQYLSKITFSLVNIKKEQSNTLVFESYNIIDIRYYPPQFKERKYDFVLLKLNRPILLEQFATLGVFPEELLAYNDNQFEINGYPEKSAHTLKGGKLKIESNLTFNSDDRLLKYKMSTYRGQSGSPIVLIMEKMRMIKKIVFGIHCGKYTNIPFNKGIPLTSQMIYTIGRWIQQMEKKKANKLMIGLSEHEGIIIAHFNVHEMALNENIQHLEKLKQQQKKQKQQKIIQFNELDIPFKLQVVKIMIESCRFTKDLLHESAITADSSNIEQHSNIFEIESNIPQQLSNIFQSAAQARKLLNTSQIQKANRKHYQQRGEITKNKFQALKSIIQAYPSRMKQTKRENFVKLKQQKDDKEKDRQLQKKGQLQLQPNQKANQQLFSCQLPQNSNVINHGLSKYVAMQQKLRND